MREIDEVMSHLPALAEKAGVPARGWQPALLSRRNDHVMHRVVVRLSAPGRAPLILKRLYAPDHPAKFAEVAGTQHEAARTIPGAPAILSWDALAQVVLMERVPGETLHDLCAQRPMSDHAPQLHAAGRWVASMHRARGTEQRLFQPKHTLRYLDKLMEEVTSGDRLVPQKRRFLAYARRLHDLAPVPEQCQTVAAMAHGDLNMRNILLDGDRGGGIDFDPPKLLPIGHDLARLFVHYGSYEWIGGAPDGSPSGPLPGTDLSAFFNGYDLTGPGDASVGFLSRMRILTYWISIPKPREDRSLRQHERFHGLQRLAARAFE